MGTHLDRRAFLRNGAGLAVGAAAGGLIRGLPAFAEPVKVSTPAAEKLGWQMAVQLYTYRRFPLYEALDKIAALGVRHIEVCFFLKLDKARPALTTNEALSPEVRKELKAKLDDRGMALSSFYAELGANADKAKKIFDFCKEMGTGVIVAEPPPEAFDMIEKLCDEYKVNLAIHNHPESPKQRYWSPETVLEVCKGRGKRIGACCDTGHWVRSGLDPVECLKKMEGRILAFHLKDAAEKGNRKSEDTPLGEGAGNYKAVLAELKRQGYKGLTTIEYEKDTDHLQDDMVKCVAFVEEQAKVLGG
jgi:sugar phosphate isomerase/epimerase